MSPRMCWICCLVLTSWCLSACERRLTVYADPWLGQYAERVTDAFHAAHPDVRVELRLLSSEVIAWHIKYGQPVDVFLCFGPEVMDSLDLKGKVDASMVLGKERMVRVATQNQGKWDDFKTRGCMALEATHRPVRRYTDVWAANAAGLLPQCKVYAGFQSQMREYLLRGWVPQGIVPQRFALAHPGILTVMDSGPVLQDAYMAFKIKGNRDESLANEFFDFIKSEKYAPLLALEHLIP